MAKTTKTVAQLEEELAQMKVSLAEARKKKIKEADDEDDDKKNVDIVKNLKKDDDGDKDAADKEDDEDDEDEDDEDKKVDESTDEGGDDESGESPFGSDKGKLKQGVKEAKKRTLTQSYREEEQPPVEDAGSPFGDDKGKLKQGVSEAISNLFKGEELSEGFKKKAATVFEAALTSQIAEATAEIEEIAQYNLAEAIAEIKEELLEQADDYVGYVVSEWLEENKLQVESSLKLEILEGFFSGLTQLYNEHNISVPDASIDLIEAKDNEVKALTEKANTLTAKLIKAEKTILEANKSQVLATLSEGLAATQVEKLKTLTKDIDAKTLESFKEKASIIKESYFSVGLKTIPKTDAHKVDGSQVVTTEGMDPSVAHYLETMKAQAE